MTTDNGQPRSEQMLAHAEEFDKETDRGAALLVAAYLDHLLEKLLSSVMIDDEKQVEILLRTPTSPLGTFSSRVRATYCLGLITKDEFIDLNIIRDIRNDFAHELVGLSFDNQSVADRSRNLLGSKVDGQPISPKECFKKASIRLMVDIILKIKEQTAPKSPQGSN